MPLPLFFFIDHKKPTQGEFLTIKTWDLPVKYLHFVSNVFFGMNYEAMYDFGQQVQLFEAVLQIHTSF